MEIPPWKVSSDKLPDLKEEGKKGKFSLTPSFFFKGTTNTSTLFPIWQFSKKIVEYATGSRPKVPKECRDVELSQESFSKIYSIEHSWKRRESHRYANM